MPGRMGAESLGFGLGPRMNAAGRIAHAQAALDLLLAGTPRGGGDPFAEHLDALNRQRPAGVRTGPARGRGAARRQRRPAHHDRQRRRCTSASSASSRGAWRSPRNRPAIVYGARRDGEPRASARTIPAFDIISAIRKDADLLERHGGHRAAAGFTIRNENVEPFRERIVNTAAELLSSEDLRRVMQIDAETALSDLTGIEVKGLTRFEPCGEGNRRPVLLSRNVKLVDSRRVGADESHLKLKVRDGAATWARHRLPQGRRRTRRRARHRLFAQPRVEGRAHGARSARLRPELRAPPPRTRDRQLLAEIKLSADGERALAEGERLATGLNIAIEAVEFLLVGALNVLRETGWPNLPTGEALEGALRSVHVEGSTDLTDRVMPGPSLRQALNMTAGAVRREGGTTIDALIIAHGMIASGEINPAFYQAFGTSQDELATLLEGRAS